MTVFHLVRHAPHILQDKVLVGRGEDVPLSEGGRRAARDLAGRFAGVAVDAIVTSPRLRARETAAAIAETSGARVEVADGLNELDFGEWTGRTLEELAHDPRWRRWNAQRAASRCPGGESMNEMWARVRDVLADLHRRAPAGAFALVTHAEPIRAAILSATGRSFDAFGAVDVAPASVTTLEGDGGTLRLAAAQAKAAA